jgi:hypothetical protein
MSSKKLAKAVAKGVGRARARVNNNVGGQSQSQSQPQQQPPQSPTINDRVDQLGDFLGEGVPKLAGKTVFGLGQLPFSLAGGMGGGFGRLVGSGIGYADSGEKIGRTVAQYGMLGKALPYLTKLVGTGWDKMTEPEEQKQARIKTEEQKKYETKFRKAVMGDRTDGFTLQDLDDSDKAQDAGWRAGVTGMKDDEYEELVTNAIKNDDPNKVWNAVIRKAQASGKKVNASKPLFLPNTFERNGKKYAYAIDGSEKDDNGLPKVRFVPIEIGKMPFAPEEK